MDMRTLTAVVHKEGNMFVAQCPEVGTTSQGMTVDEALANLKEATELYLQEFPRKDWQRPILTTFEVEDGAKA
jgi:predicted RNase H-like HicB family nuclease